MFRDFLESTETDGMHDIYLLLRTIRDLRSETAGPEVDVRLKKLEREIETELLESQESHDWAEC